MSPKDPIALKSGRLRLRLSRTAESEVRHGHPWVFSNSIREQSRPGKLGELAIIYDRNNSFLASGLFDPDSSIRIRIIHTGKPIEINSAWWRARLKTALDHRRSLFSSDTTGLRYINGESDGWPGLVLDQYEDALVVKIYTLAWLPRLKDLVAFIQEQFPASALILRLSRNIQKIAREHFGCGDGQILAGILERPLVIFRETGLSFEADVVQGQKTGFFLDQRENRRIVESFALGRSVLNAFSFSGGFSVYAARGGASSVTDLDISSHALESSKRNFALNQSQPHISSVAHHCIQADAFAWLESARSEQFDLVILDPPSLAKKATDKAAALNAYGKLADAGRRQLRPGGILAFSSCTAHVTAEEFFELVRERICSGGEGVELRTTLQPPDHPASFKEANYLKCIYFRV